MPQANHIINISFPIKLMRANRLGTKAGRPLSPFEQVVCNGKRIDLRPMWGDMHAMFSQCVGKKEEDKIKQHEQRGM
jgi:hypothetical protein